MGRKGSRYTIEEKLFYIGLVRNKGKSYKAIQYQYGVKDEQTKQWVERYEKDGIDGLRRRSLQRYTQDFKLKLVRIYLEGTREFYPLIIISRSTVKVMDADLYSIKLPIKKRFICVILFMCQQSLTTAIYIYGK
ncbi:transposase [Lactobacillus sp. ZJLC29-4]|uniref:Transposase n=2 Tax=Levilactobacillus tujiorum TaxID=2912243 RepID=A0ABX1L5P2_9LACO|nr:transposase [Lactobacillus sp. HBUAS51387]NLR29197.1 transposase [Levilactobacillus tujiorum]